MAEPRNPSQSPKPAEKTRSDASASSAAETDGRLSSTEAASDAAVSGPDQAAQGDRAIGADTGRVYAGDGTSAGDTVSPVPRGWGSGHAVAMHDTRGDSRFVAEPHDHTIHWPSGAVSTQELSRMIAEAAYFRAERRGFHAGYEIEDWLGAEAEIKARLREIEQAARVGTPGG